MSATESQELPQERVAPGDAIPPAGEDIHLPGGSFVPLAFAIGVTLVVVGSTIDWKIWSSIGAAVALVSLFIWIRDTRREISHLPEEHGH